MSEYQTYCRTCGCEGADTTCAKCERGAEITALKTTIQSFKDAMDCPYASDANAVLVAMRKDDRIMGLEGELIEARKREEALKSRIAELEARGREEWRVVYETQRSYGLGDWVLMATQPLTFAEMQRTLALYKQSVRIRNLRIEFRCVPNPSEWKEVGNGN